ncbi:beta-fructofuranosidase [Spiroplasma chinense]|uniref:beta-fructofuranosidase n=1 Tax=Spiroplasma chinense TaxID=216932 RepID=A0A5B9Y5F1_9MOLU|nr:GH32 C-terminal domain-containing protein [Spiroplasma chinense]QEH62180.1 beta-fructofuranosidase [Spiroplasma chinense]
MNNLEYKQKLINDNDKKELNEKHLLKMNDPYKNKILLSSYSGLTNDPVGLNYFKGEYNIFLQNAPFTHWHANKSWGYFKTKNFKDYKYLGLAITPSIDEDLNGAFSGSAFIEEGELKYFYTGNRKVNDERISHTIEAKVDVENKETHKKVLFKNPEFTNGECRDPYIFKDGKNKFMACGASNGKKGVFLLWIYDYEKKQWNFHCELKIDLPLELEGYMIECPSFIKINEKDWLLAWSNEQTEEQTPFMHHKTLYAIGNFDKDFMSFKLITEPKLINEGPDFYAPQFFESENGNMMTGWLGNSKNEQNASQENCWAFDLALIRDVNVIDKVLYQKPVIKQLMSEEVFNSFESLNWKNEPLYIQATNKKDFFLEIFNDKNEKLRLVFDGEILKVERDEMTFTDKINLPSYEVNLSSVSEVEIIIDSSVIEIFFNNGEKVISIKYFVKDPSNLNSNLEIKKIVKLNPLNIEWENNIFKQSN